MRQPQVPYTAGARRFWTAIGLALTMATTGAMAADCAKTGQPAPEVVTLMASLDKPATQAWVVSPDCSVKTIKLGAGGDPEGSFSATSRGIEHVVSVPTDTMTISLRDNPLTRGANFSMATMATDVVVSNVPKDPKTLLLPPSLQFIYFGGVHEGDIQTLDGIEYPDTLLFFAVSYSSIKSFKNVHFPSGLQQISLEQTMPNVMDYNFPPGLQWLSVDSYSVWDFTKLVLPDKLQEFSYTGIGDEIDVHGVRWPASLDGVNFYNTTLWKFEIRQSDFETFQRLGSFTADVTQTSCDFESATPAWIYSTRLCVIPDAVFDANYGLTPSPTSGSPEGSGSTATTSTPKPTAGKDNSNDGSSSKDDIAVGATPTPAAKPGARPASSNTQASTTSTQASALSSPTRPASLPSAPESYSDDDLENLKQRLTPKTSTKASASGTTTTENPSTQYGTEDAASPSPGPSPEDSPKVHSGGSGDQSSDSITIIVLSSLLSLMVGAAIYRVAVKVSNRRQGLEKGANSYHAVGTPTVALSGSAEPTEVPTVSDTPSAGVEFLAVAFRTDKDLIRCRIDAVTIEEAPIARGGFGVVYRGSYEGRTVAVKQLPQGVWEEDHVMVAQFVDEIRLCARLDHHKIVQFVGVSWTDGQQDLSAVSEFMAGGDLHAAIHAHPESTGHEWGAPWAAGRLPSKALLALDVAEAVVYLHSFQAPILHRDLKAKNVLLDDAGHAKLSDFGISREMALTTAMTSNVGTAAWIAPEVLRGEQYSDKADIYSLGVLLVELDRCSHPYAHETVLQPASSSEKVDIEHKNTQIAVLVSTGQLRPSTSAACPPSVASLVSRCVSFDANARPTAMEAFYELRQIHKSNQQRQQQQQV